MVGGLKWPDLKLKPINLWSLPRMDVCPNCGGELSGDGYKMPIHCLEVSEEDWWYEPPDSGPYYCNYQDYPEPTEYDEWQDYDPDC